MAFPGAHHIPLWPAAASAHASAVDLLFVGLVASSALVLLLLSFLLLRFAIHYRAGNAAAERDHRIRKSWHWEVSWTVATLVAFLALFVWGAKLYRDLVVAPADALVVYVVAQQWMWKAQHLEGAREINELHLPLGRAIRVILSSQDVIHSFFLPAFRLKRDVLPGTFQELWFQPTRPGVYPLFCAEYCGTDHSRMLGRIVVMEPARFTHWLAQQHGDTSLAAQGAALYRALGCAACHAPGSRVPAPPLDGLYGRIVAFADGSTAVADDGYIRESILRPHARVRAGYAPAMPAFAGRVSETELAALMAYIKSRAAQEASP